MKKENQISVRLSHKDKKFLDDFNISPTELFRSALKKQKAKIKRESKKRIIIEDWTGKILFQGPYSSPEVKNVLEANKCKCKQCEDHRTNNFDDSEYCKNSDFSGYLGDFQIFWENENDKTNVYEYIDY